VGVPAARAEDRRARARTAPRDGDRRGTLLDVGTGTGAIALAVADEHPCAHVTGVDASLRAVSLAQENVDELHVGGRVEIRPGDIGVAAEGWDLVVSNPPYVAPDEWDVLQPEIREWEPREALVGVGLHERIARVARTRWLVLEAGECQADDVAAMLESLAYTRVRVTPDLAGKPRVVEGRRE
jgi:release factor glutamine methyltransferase